MLPRKREGIRTFYFTSEHPVHAGCALPRSSAGVHLLRRPAVLPGVMGAQGTMEVLEDAWAKELIWPDGDETYYPGWG